MNETQNPNAVSSNLCKNCQKLNISNDQSDCSNNSIEKCANWLSHNTSKFNSDESESICSSEISDLTKFSEEYNCCSDEFTTGNKEIRLYEDINDNHYDTILRSSINTYQNVSITKSKNVHLGNVTYINGPVYVNQTANIVNNQTIINQYINNSTADVKAPRIVKRMGWLAQPPLAEYEIRENPAKIVIITHSATEHAISEPDNILLVRLIQQFHVESRKWDDIGYNFLVGADGNIYEGRGWNAVGAHTYNYNRISIGICFIGYYNDKLPPQSALNNAKRLIEYGVSIGAIDKNYYLLGHCQCSTTQSPGEKLFEEIKNWKNWNNEVDTNNIPDDMLKLMTIQE